MQRTNFAIVLDKTSGIPLSKQVYDGLREAISDHAARGKRKLPSTRQLARDLGVSRNTVIGAYKRLLSEGVLESFAGFGTVARFAPGELPDGKDAL